NYEFVHNNVNNSEELKETLSRPSWGEIEKSSAISREWIGELADPMARSKDGVMLWALGLSMHKHGTHNISQVCNLSLLRGWLVRKYNGLMPLRGHSSVQGSGEMGADPFVLPGGDYDEANRERIEAVWNFKLPEWPGDSVGITIENAMLP